ncbi:hypothetical protein Bbelb_163960 [Branchiostoma belcheri]|nr:hypothetical protein Bbelb_163960 [Branchiostoma belcheri]
MESVRKKARGREGEGGAREGPRAVSRLSPEFYPGPGKSLCYLGVLAAHIQREPPKLYCLSFVSREFAVHKTTRTKNSVEGIPGKSVEAFPGKSVVRFPKNLWRHSRKKCGGIPGKFPEQYCDRSTAACTIRTRQDRPQCELEGQRLVTESDTASENQRKQERGSKN